MKKILITIFAIVLLLAQVMAVSALTANEAKDEWQDAKQLSKEAQKEYADAKIVLAGNNTPENVQNVVDTGKKVLHAALNEAEAWLNWKNLEAQENTEVPDEIKQNIKQDVENNLQKIAALRQDVDNVKNQLDLGLVFLKMIGKYAELLTDVARNTGSMWVHIGNTYADTIGDYEGKLRAKADAMSDNTEILSKLDMAKAELDTAKRNINNAQETYKLVKLPGTPIIKFAEGNSYLQAAKINLIAAHGYLIQAYNAMALRGE